MVTHWFFAIPRYVNQPLPLPPPSGNTKYRTSPEMSDGMNVIRQPMSTSALMVMRFMINLRSYEDCAGKNIFRNPAYLCAEFFQSDRFPLNFLAGLFPPTLLSNRPSTKIFITPSANYQITIGVIEHD
jgi:hypothetical protein